MQESCHHPGGSWGLPKGSAMPNTEYVHVPVPRHLVLDVLQLIEAAADAGHEAAEPISYVRVETRTWSRTELEFLWDNRSVTSVGKFCQVMTLLTSKAPALLTHAEMGEALGVDFLRYQNAFGRFTTYVEKRLGNDRWPLVFSTDGRWGVDEVTAEHWREISASE